MKDGPVVSFSRECGCEVYKESNQLLGITNYK